MDTKDGGGTLQQYARDIVVRFWAANRKAMLLSALGLVLRRNYAELMAEQKTGLQRFIEGIEALRIVKHPTESQKIGVVPVGIEVPADVVELFADKGQPKRPRLVRDFWEAFHRTIATKRFAIFEVGQPVRIVDQVAAPEGAFTSYEILPDDIVSPDPSLFSERITTTWEKVDAWLKRNGLDVGAVILEDTAFAPPHRGKLPVRSTHEAIIRALSRLSVEDQARISIPFDIVNKLFDGR